MLIRIRNKVWKPSTLQSFFGDLPFHRHSPLTRHRPELLSTSLFSSKRGGKKLYMHAKRNSNTISFFSIILYSICFLKYCTICCRRRRIKAKNIIYFGEKKMFSRFQKRWKKVAPLRKYKYQLGPLVADSSGPSRLHKYTPFLGVLTKKIG